MPTCLKLVTVLKLTEANRARNVITFISFDRSINTDRPCIVMNHLLHSKSQILFSSKRKNMSPCIKHQFSLRELLFEPMQFRTTLLHHLLHKIIHLKDGYLFAAYHGVLEEMLLTSVPYGQLGSLGPRS